MSDMPQLQLPVTRVDPERPDMIILSIVVGGHLQDFRLSRQTAAALIGELAATMATTHKRIKDFA
jgi:hypothetical protein